MPCTDMAYIACTQIHVFNNILRMSYDKTIIILVIF